MPEPPAEHARATCSTGRNHLPDRPKSTAGCARTTWADSPESPASHGGTTLSRRYKNHMPDTQLKHCTERLEPPAATPEPPPEHDAKPTCRHAKISCAGYTTKHLRNSPDDACRACWNHLSDIQKSTWRNTHHLPEMPKSPAG
uniref:Uncharacterized protein n=1 Tax=Parascaris univalens TaxID=6257 RepID=A0A915CLI7_PARUN